jgi:multiple sugar transport system substrate-binding protein
MRRMRRITGMTAIAAAALAATACTGGGAVKQQTITSVDPYPTSMPNVTIKLWHGFSEGVETTAFNAMITAFEKVHPNIKVVATPNIGDSQIQAGIKAGGGNAPDVAVSFTTDDVGTYCQSNYFINLNQDIKAAQIDMASTFPAPLIKYTNYQGDQCALPLENDAYGLYYDKTEFAAAGLSTPPTTLSQLQTDALALTKKNPDGSFKQLGFVPSLSYFEQAPGHFTSVFGIQWQNSAGKSDLAGSPGWTAMLTWQRSLDQAILNQAPKSTQAQLNAFETKIMQPGEFTSGQNPFETGTVAMQMDGEWRNQNIQNETPKLSYGTAPFPVPDADASSYGGGYVTGTIIGIASTSKNQAADWELVKYLTTNTDTLVNFANVIYNVPSTLASLQSPTLSQLPQFQTMVKISGNANSQTTPGSPNGGNYQIDAQNWEAKWEAGQIGAAQLPAALQQLDTQINADAAAGTRPSGT